MSELNVTVLIDDKKVDLETATARLQALGLRVTQTLQTLGIVNGVADESAIEQLASVVGVISVRKEHTFQLQSVRKT